MKRPVAADPAKLDLTSMIDVVFLLIVFFVLVTDMASAEMEVLALPAADQAVLDENPRDHRIVLNVNAGGDVVYRRKRLSQPQLATLIRVNARLRPTPGKPELSDLPVLIRGDANAEYRVVQQIMQLCATYKVWRIELAAEQP